MRSIFPLMTYANGVYYRDVDQSHNTFLRQADDVWTDDGREAFVDFIARNPEAGDVIRDGGGVRKVRWGRQGTGKRGGARVIYFFHDLDTPLYLLLVYAKAVRTDLSPDAKRR